MPIPSLASVGGLEFDSGYAGQIADAGPVIIETRINESATAIDFGVAVTRGAAVTSGVGKVKPLVSSGQVPVGISVKYAADKVATTDGNNTVNYPQYDDVPVMKEGTIWALPFEDVVEGDGVVAIPAQNGKLGGTTAGAANGTTRMAVDGAVWLQTQTAASGLRARLRIVNRV
jgi:hypothetical protein